MFRAADVSGKIYFASKLDFGCASGNFILLVNTETICLGTFVVT